MPEESRKPVLYSAVQPSGTLTIGNYIGALRNFKLLEQDYDCLFCMADLHALTVRQEPAALRRRTAELMAADILLYQTDVVPVGADQKQHLEICRDIANRFNSIYGDVFRIPEPYISKSAAARIMSLNDPSSKMSKSGEPDSFISVMDTPDDIRRKLRRAVTDSDGEIRVDAENKPGVTNLITICAAMSNRTPEQVCQDLAGQGYGALKDAAAEAVIATLAPIQAEHKRIMADKAYIADVLKDGAERASAIAFKTLRKVYKKVGLYQG